MLNGRFANEAVGTKGQGEGSIERPFKGME